MTNYEQYLRICASLDLDPLSEQEFAEGESSRDDTPLPTALVVGDGRVRIVQR